MLGAGGPGTFHGQQRPAVQRFAVQRAKAPSLSGTRATLANRACLSAFCPSRNYTRPRRLRLIRAEAPGPPAVFLFPKRTPSRKTSPSLLSTRRPQAEPRSPRSLQAYLRSLVVDYQHCRRIPSRSLQQLPQAVSSSTFTVARQLHPQTAHRLGIKLCASQQSRNRIPLLPTTTTTPPHTNKMRSFQSVVFFLFALLACAFAQDTEVYDATVYITSTVFRVNTIYQSGSPTGPVYNSTSTISAVLPTGHANTTVAPTASQAKPSPPAFTGAASALNANAFLAAFAAGVGYLVL